MTDAIVVAPKDCDEPADLCLVVGAPPDLDESGESPSAELGVLPTSVGKIDVDVRDCRRCRFGATCTGRAWFSPCTGGLGGAAAMGTTPGLPPVVPVRLVGVVTAEPECAES